MNTEKRDAIIGLGIVAVLVVLYLMVYSAKTEESTQPETEDNQSGFSNSPIQYNIPPTLTLPPYNVGNTSTQPNDNNHECNCGTSQAPKCSNINPPPFIPQTQVIFADINKVIPPAPTYNIPPPPAPPPSPAPRFAVG